MINAARCFLRLGEGNAAPLQQGQQQQGEQRQGGQQRVDTVLVVGDGATPRTAALFAYMTKGWRCVSVDPLMEAAAAPSGGFDGSAEAAGRVTAFVEHPWRGVEGLCVVPRRVEQAVVKARRLVVVLMHAHVPLDAVERSVDCEAVAGVIACPCCNWAPVQASWRGAGPQFVYDDPSMLSDRREVRVWAPPGGAARTAGMAVHTAEPATEPQPWMGPMHRAESDEQRAVAEGDRSVDAAAVSAIAAQSAANEASMRVCALKKASKRARPPPLREPAFLSAEAGGVAAGAGATDGSQAATLEPSSAEAAGALPLQQHGEEGGAKRSNRKAKREAAAKAASAESIEAGRVLKERQILVRQERERLRMSLVEQSLRDRTGWAGEATSTVAAFVGTYAAGGPAFDGKLEDTAALDHLPSVRVRGRVTSARVRNRYLAFLTLSDAGADDESFSTDEATLKAQQAALPTCQVLLSASHLSYPVSDAAPFAAVSNAIKRSDIVICEGAAGRTQHGGLTLFCGKILLVSVPMPSVDHLPQSRVG